MLSQHDRRREAGREFDEKRRQERSEQENGVSAQR
jgi:hypothetical protein